MFEVGTVLRIFATEAKPDPKVKYIIIIGGDSDYIYFIFINTEVNPNYLSTNLQSQHLAISNEECPYLKEEESYANCAEVFCRKKAEMNQLLQKEPGRVQKPPLPKVKIEKILEIMRNSKSMSSADKRKYGLL